MKEEPKSDGEDEDDDSSGDDKTEDHAKLIEYGLDKKVADRLDDIYKTGDALSQVSCALIISLSCPSVCPNSFWVLNKPKVVSL